jgi:hypothetical protein
MNSSASEFSAEAFAASPAHAILLYGTEGAPLRESAERLAAIYVCAAEEGERPCGACAPCRARLAGGLVDLQVIDPFGNPPIHGLEIVNESKTARAEQFAGVPLRKFFRTRPLTAPHKVAVVHEMQRANLAAANALLKTVEEPPAYAKLIFTTTILSRVLPTIRSRCVCISVDKPVVPPIAGVPSWGEAARDSDDEARLLELDDILRESVTSAPGEAIRNGHRFRKWADAWREKYVLSAREGLAHALSLMAQWSLVKVPDNAENLHATLAAHRLILGNVQEGLVLDVLFCEWAGTSPPLGQ